MSGNSSTEQGSKGFFQNTGAVAGTFVVVGLVVAAGITFLAWLFFRRRRTKRLNEDLRVAAGGAGDGGAGVDRFSGEEDEPFDSQREMGSFSTSGVINGAYLGVRGGSQAGGGSGGGGNRESLHSTGSNHSQVQQPYYNAGVNPYAVNNYYGTTYGNEAAYSGASGVGYSQENLGNGPVARHRNSDESLSGEGAESRDGSGNRSEEGMREFVSQCNNLLRKLMLKFFLVQGTSYGNQISYPEYAAVNRRDSGDSLSHYGNDARRQIINHSGPLPSLPSGSDQRVDSAIALGLGNQSLTSLADEKDYSAKRILR